MRLDQTWPSLAGMRVSCSLRDLTLVAIACRIISEHMLRPDELIIERVGCLLSVTARIGAYAASQRVSVDVTESSNADAFVPLVDSVCDALSSRAGEVPNTAHG